MGNLNIPIFLLTLRLRFFLLSSKIIMSNTPIGAYLKGNGPPADTPLRDYIAITAMHAMILKGNSFNKILEKTYNLADKMLSRRNWKEFRTPYEIAKEPGKCQSTIKSRLARFPEKWKKCRNGRIQIDIAFFRSLGNGEKKDLICI